MHTAWEHVQYVCVIITSLIVGGLAGGSIAVYFEMRSPMIMLDIVQSMYIVYSFIITTVLGRMLVERIPEKW